MGLRLRCLIYWHPLYSTPFTMLMNLADYSSRNQFLSSFVVEPYTPEREFILARYQALLANKKLGPAETQELQQDQC